VRTLEQVMRAHRFLGLSRCYFLDETKSFLESSISFFKLFLSRRREEEKKALQRRGFLNFL